MLSRFCSAVVLSGLLFVPAVAQTTIRFDTNAGSIDFLLNPTNNPNLQLHEENILTYVNSGRYDLSVINRAADGDPNDPNDDFVLQFGGFSLDPLVLPSSFDAFTNIPSFDPVIVDQDGDGNVDFDLTGLSNTRGTVSLALNATGPNSGTSSFFVNLGDNSASLDPQSFIPFAEVVDMATVDLILSLPQTDFVGGGLAGDDVPTVNGTGVVFIERAFVLEAEGSTTAITFSTVTRQDTAGDSSEVTFSTLIAAGDADAGGSTPVTFSDLTPASDSSSGSAPITFSTVTPIAQALSSSESSSAGASLPLLSSPASAISGSTAAVQALTVPEPPALVLAIAALVAIYVMKPGKKR